MLFLTPPTVRCLAGVHIGTCRHIETTAGPGSGSGASSSGGGGGGSAGSRRLPEDRVETDGAHLGSCSQQQPAGDDDEGMDSGTAAEPSGVDVGHRGCTTGLFVPAPVLFSCLQRAVRTRGEEGRGFVGSLLD